MADKTLEEVKELEDYAISSSNLLLAYRLAIEFDDLNISTKTLEKFIIKSKNPKFIFRFAKEIQSCNLS